MTTETTGRLGLECYAPGYEATCPQCGDRHVTLMRVPGGPWLCWPCAHTEAFPDERTAPNLTCGCGCLCAEHLDAVEDLAKLRAAHAAQLVALREGVEEWIAKTIGPRDAQRFYSDCKRGIIPLPDAEAALEKVREEAVRDFLAKGPGGGYEVAAPFEGGPLTRVRRRGWQGHEWGFAYPEQARAVANALNALGAKGREQ